MVPARTIKTILAHTRHLDRLNYLLFISIVYLTSGCAAVKIPNSSVPPMFASIEHDNEAIEDHITIGLLGNTNVLISDGHHSVLVDGFFTRRNIFRSLVGADPDTKRIQTALKHYNVAQNDQLDAIVVTHSHFDHAMDAPVLGSLTDATVIGSPSTKNIIEGYNDDPFAGEFNMSNFQNVNHEKDFTWSNKSFVIRLFKTSHGGGRRPISKLIDAVSDGRIKRKLPSSATIIRYKKGDVYVVWIKHIKTDKSFLIQTSAGFASIPDGLTADVTFLSLGHAAAMPPDSWESYYHTFVEQRDAKLVIPIHWEDFFSASTPIKARSNLTDGLADAVCRIETRVNQDPNINLYWLKPHERLVVEAQ